ncbi:MAG: hypothetical protein EPO07_08200 [Verrucomicrobia bacterium]|nr:MAG: hypothetical protein EPO07_08200 [Verrucomicrobiota bacterium]
MSAIAGNQPTAGGKANLPSGPTQLRNAFDLCVHKTRDNIKRLADDPKSAAWAVDGNYFAFNEGFHEIGNWTSSFFTGMAVLAWRETKDVFFLQQLLRLAPHYLAKAFKQHRHTHHDLGFLYSLYSVALYKLTGEKLHRETGLRAAAVLARRFNPSGNFIRAWGYLGTDDFNDMAIIDCLMNLPLLHWATNETGDQRYREIAIKHADMVLKNFVRPDDSVYHAYRFDLKTGRPLRADTYGGIAVESHWARGMAWAIYGFALSHKYTQDARYLDAASRIALAFIHSLDREIVPVWDFRLPAGATPLRDSSALAVAVCGLFELAQQGGQDSKFFHSTRPMLLRLCAEDYLNSDPACPGILRNGQVGNGVPGGAQNAYTSWGDYFLMEALSRELRLGGTFW